ncbi:AmiS/UreI family transporter [Leucobacter sp. W1153]|uniref:AmiS/UreI family transporter n=1 Tax=Leucobacter sp. W1153 TaxID=3439064 RepID=UPI00403612DE
MPAYSATKRQEGEVGSVGLLYVGAVLVINGLMLLNIVPGKSAAALNLFVGGMQVIFPTLTLLTADGDPAVILGASGLYLFGFTYLYVAWNQLTGASGEGLGWFSLFVSACALVYGALQFTLVNDPVFGVIWFSWAVLWFLFFLVLALNREDLTRVTGWFTLMLGVLTGAVPAFLLLTQTYQSTAVGAVIAAVIAVLVFLFSWMLGKPKRPISSSHEASQAAVSAPQPE